MAINQESILLISMPNSAKTVSQMHIPPKTHFQKAVGGVRKLFCGHSSRIKSDIKLNFVLNSSSCMQKIYSNSFIILESKPFHLWQWSFDIVFVFWKQCVCTWPSRIRFSIVILCLWLLERCPDVLNKDCHRQTPKPVVWTYSLVIASQPKGAIFALSKSWVVSTGSKHHKIMRNRDFIHFMQFCGQWITHTKKTFQYI